MGFFPLSSPPIWLIFLEGHPTLSATESLHKALFLSVLILGCGSLDIPHHHFGSNDMLLSFPGSVPRELLKSVSSDKGGSCSSHALEEENLLSGILMYILYGVVLARLPLLLLHVCVGNGNGDLLFPTYMVPHISWFVTWTRYAMHALYLLYTPSMSVSGTYTYMLCTCYVHVMYIHTYMYVHVDLSFNTF